MIPAKIIMVTQKQNTVIDPINEQNRFQYTPLFEWVIKLEMSKYLPIWKPLRSASSYVSDSNDNLHSVSKSSLGSTTLYNSNIFDSGHNVPHFGIVNGSGVSVDVFL